MQYFINTSIASTVIVENLYNLVIQITDVLRCLRRRLQAIRFGAKPIRTRTLFTTSSLDAYFNTKITVVKPWRRLVF
jgi:hypothetical protein